MDAADSFVRVVARLYEAGYLGVDFIVEVGEGGRRKLCQAISFGELWAGGCSRRQNSPRCAASTVWRRLCAPFCRVSSFLGHVSTALQAMRTCEAHFERRSSTMRSSEDDACCDMVTASPEAPDRRGGFDRER